MKRYIKSNKIYKGEYNHSYAGKPSSESTVEVLGDSFGGMKIFHVVVSKSGQPDVLGHDFGYFVGKLPNHNINFFGESAWDVKEAFGIDGNDYTDSEEFVNDINDEFLNMLNSPKSQCAINDIGIDPLSLPWKISCSRFLVIGDVYCTMITYSDIRPQEHYILKLIRDNGNEVPSSFSKEFLNYFDYYIKDAMREIKLENKREQIRQQPYSLGASDEVAEAVHSLYNQVQRLSSYVDLDTAKDILTKSTFLNKRSSKYQRPEVEQSIDILFNWAVDNDLDVPKLKKVCRKIYQKYLLN